jgi:hypothetical protein
VVQKTDQKADDVEKLAKKIEGLNAFLNNAKIGTLPPAVTDGIGDLGRWAPSLVPSIDLIRVRPAR